METKLKNKRGWSRKAMWLNVVLCVTLLLGSVLLKSKPVLAAGKIEALVLNCMDYRLVKYIELRMAERGLTKNYDQIVLAGAALGANNTMFTSWGRTFREHIATAISLHSIKKIVIVDHRNCGAYKVILHKDFPENLTPADPQYQVETTTHAQEMNKLAKQIKQVHPQLMIELLLMDLKGNVETIPIDGPTGQALAFDGVDDWISTTKSLSWPPNQAVSFEFLAKLIGGGASEICFFDTESRENISKLVFDKNILTFEIYGQQYSVSNFRFDESWHHYAVTFDQSNVSFYLDGGLLSSVPVIKGNKTVAGSLRIGAERNGWSCLKGQLDEFRVWNYARTRDEIMADRHCELTGKEEGLVLYYNFNQEKAGADNTTSPTARTANDLTESQKNHGTLKNFELTGIASNWVAPSEKTTSGPLGEALDFDGKDDYVTIDQNDALNALPLTVEAWIKTSQNVATEISLVNQYFVASGKGWNMYLENGKLRGWYFKDGANKVHGHGVNADKLKSTTFVADGHWHHVAFVVDNIGGGRIYVDGKKEGGSLAWQGQAGKPNIHVGASLGYYPGQGSMYKGQMDEVRIWNSALTDQEISKRIKIGTSGKKRSCELTGNEPGLIAYYKFNEGVANASNNELGNTILYDAAKALGGENNGRLVNFGLTGEASNWVAPGRVRTGETCP